MRLITAYIENFGKLSKFTYDFNEGLNVIEEENGWGKTTFAAFIKAMFYGLEYRRGQIVTDRKRYKSWNGNKFGGYIIFEKGGTQYKIERFFGRLEREDTLVVYNMSKNIITDELGNNPGEIIWKVDRDSYEKTAFITLKDSSLLNDIISSKLGNIEDQEADLETSTQAVKSLDDELVKIKARRGSGGFLGDKQEALAQLKRDLKQYKGSLATIGDREDEIKNKEEELATIDGELTTIDEEQSKLILYEKKQQYDDLKGNFETREKEYSEIESFFNGKNLSEKELHEIKEEAGKYISQKDQADKNKLSEGQEDELKELAYNFKENIPEPFEIEVCNENITALSNQRTQLNSYKTKSEDQSRFTQLELKYKTINLESNTIDGYLNDFNLVAELGLEENSINMEIGKLDSSKGIQTSQKRKGEKSPLFFIGIGLFILGLLMAVVLPPVGVVVAIIGLVLGIYTNLKPKNLPESDLSKANVEVEGLKARLKEITEKKKDLEAGYLSFLKSIGEKPANIASALANSKLEVSEYHRLKEQALENVILREEVGEKISQLKQEIELFLGKYYNMAIINDYEKTLSDLRGRVSRFKKLSDHIDLYQSNKDQVDKLKEGLAEKFSHYYKEFPSNVTDAANDLTKKYYALETSTSQLRDSKESKEVFELANDISELEKVSLPEVENDEFLATLRQQKESLSQGKDNLIRRIESCRKDIHRLSLHADQIEDTESTITQLELDIEELGKEHELLNLAKECMLQAKENLATKYMGDMSHTFEKYLGLLNNGQIDSYKMDINLDVKIEHEGELYDSNQLSTGMKDLVQLCMRMALVEAVYKDVDKPVLVLDDPFINLDSGRLENAMRLLEEISEEYQVIYFICHSSRNLL